MSTDRYSLAVLLLVLLASSALGGKLGRIRDRASGRKRSAPTPAAKSSSHAPESTVHEEEPVPQPSRSHREQKKSSRSTGGKLAAIVSEVRPRPASLPRPNRPTPQPDRAHRHRPAARRPNRSIGFGHLHLQPACPTPIIEEHYYYPSQPVIVDSPSPRLPVRPPYEAGAEPMSKILQDSGTVAGPPAVTEPIVLESSSTEWLKPYYLRFGMDYASDVDDVSRMGFDLLANATGGLGIDTGARLFRERGQDYRDHLWIGDFNVVYELVPTDWLRPRAGIGLSWLADGYGAEAGLNLTCGADVLLGPIALAGEFDFGTLGAADLVHLRATAGIMQSEFLEWFAGYDHLEIGGVEVRGVVAGLRVRF